MLSATSSPVFLEDKPPPDPPFRARLRAQLARLGKTNAPWRAADDTNELRCLRAVSGFRNVYQSGNEWIAKVKENGQLLLIPGSRQPSPQQSAAYVVAYYKARFGSHWREALSNRKRTAWRASYSKKFRGWVLAVWVDGVKQRFDHPAFPTRERANDWAQEWLTDLLVEPVWRGT